MSVTIEGSLRRNNQVPDDFDKLRSIRFETDVVLDLVIVDVNITYACAGEQTYIFQCYSVRLQFYRVTISCMVSPTIPRKRYRSGR